MATSNSLFGSDDELFVNGADTEPPPFTFQSDLSDDDAPDPLALDEIASASLAAMAGTLESLPWDKNEAETKPQQAPKGGQVNGVAESPMDEPEVDVGSVIEIHLPWLPPAYRAGYQKVEVDDYWPGEDEYLRTRRKRKGDDDYDDFAERYGTKKRKRQDEDYNSSDELNGDSDEDELPRLRSRRASTRASSLLVSSEGEHREAGRRLRLRPRASIALYQNSQEDDRDELQGSDLDDDTFIVQSDIVQTKKTRRRLRRMPTRGRSSLSLGGEEIEFESRRRSSRANKTSKVMTDAYLDDEDIFYDDEKTPAAPKIMSMREVFQPSPSYDFKEAHRPICDTCGYGDDKNKGALIPCQGCSNSYHKACLGTRSTRDHRVTKVAVDSFVMQCRFCVCTYKKKDDRAPSHDVCQTCHAKNPACAPFSERKTPKQEEILRNENGGVDPITPVEAKLLNNPDNVLFRCGRCHRAWHYEHLPHPNKSRDPAIDDPLNLRKHRREEYQIEWMCKECQDTWEDKVDKMVAWRPLDPKAYREGQSITDFSEDNLEYLLKFENKSYNHCVWMPGAWVFGVVKPTMRQSFIKRTFGDGSDEAIDGGRHVDSLLRWSEKEAIHDSWITPDIILDVHYAPRSREDEKKYRAKSATYKFEDDLSRIFHVIKIYVKFEGLGYDDAVWDTPPPPDAGPLYDAFCEAYREYLNGRHFQSEPWKVIKERIETFRELDFIRDIEVHEQPKGLRRGKLMGYQLKGLNWMLLNFRQGRNVVLADEMGLGKTVQVVALLSSFIQDNPKIWPFLIVVPNATCANWRREIKKWAPDLRVVAYYGGRVSQALALNYELFPNGTKDLKAHIVIMSYDSAKDSETRSRFSSTKWAGLIVDEAQALKNDENTLYKALNALRIPFKLLLTGTPLQNNKRELFNLLQFINPAMKAEELDQQFAQITSDNLKDLHELIRPYFLRRTKAEVLTFLPPMAQIIIPVSMTVLQERLCKSIMERNPQLIRSIFIQGKMKASERGSLSNILMQLRKCLCHPFIYSQAIEDRSVSPEVSRRNLVEASSKLMLLEIMLPKLKERGHRVLLFSQFLDELTILEDFLAGMGMKHERLDGSQSSMEKQKKIDAFNAPDSDIFAMLLSTRAGGVGINLATADTVIILDPDWNPHQDIQALSRAHRIGQRKKVLCFQLMTVDSPEEKILQIGRKKMALDHLLIETMDNDEESLNDVESVLKYGAAALFGEGKKKEAITYDSAAVDKLLDRSVMEETRTNDDKSAESAFAMARVWANDEGALADDLQETEPTINMSVWDQILKERAEEARREAERTMEKLGRGGRRRGAATTYTGPRFEFDDGQDGAPADSDHGDGDGEFVGSGAESSETEDEGTAATGQDSSRYENQENPFKGSCAECQSHSSYAQEQAGQRSNKQLTQGAADSEPDAQAAAVKKVRSDSRHAKGDETKAATTAAVLRPADSDDLARNADQGRPRKKKQQAAAGPTRAGARQLNGGTGSQLNGGTSSQPVLHLSRTGNSIISTTPIPAPVIPPPPTHVSPNFIIPLPSSSAVFTPDPQLDFLFQEARRAVQVQVQTPQPPAQALAHPEIPSVLCFVCEFRHPPQWECPEMRTEVKLRLALDRLRQGVGTEGLSPAAVEARRAFLEEKLRRVRGGSSISNGNGAAPNGGVGMGTGLV
ncbi:PHD/FYVE-zinc-finger like domain-containing protein [Achaetomium macrosporum]|uniref:PHD/FYVE-zinc-finger like domain-containing protein n=1 Tax=Achaetomium macrosporum TaxID=79813 RepID=A0AAN7CGF3_9PEZI|nr:PHD/FYVE-zinc-finger like domain-containing protein [Achaetomium macrosporum]